MRILFASSSSGSRGGGELYLLFLGEAMTKEGIEVGLWCSTHPRMNELANTFSKIGKVFRSGYINTYDYKLRSLRYLLPHTCAGLIQAIRDFQPDVVHVNKQNVEDGLDLLQTLDELNVPFVATVHITQTQRSLRAFMGAWRDRVSKSAMLNSKCAQWITISQARHNDLVTFLGRNENVALISNGVKIHSQPMSSHKSQARRKLDIPVDHLVVVSVGRMEQQKDPLRFVDWANQCLKVQPKMSFFWIGDGSLRQDFEYRVDDLNLKESVQCLGWQQEIDSFYSMADIYVHTATFEGLPFSLLEAMAWRLPCVVSEELSQDLAFPKEAISTGLEELKLLISDKSLIETRSTKAYEFVKENFSLESCLKLHLTIYNRIVTTYEGRTQRSNFNRHLNQVSDT